ncbi:MAG: ammonia-forming cytochrome c nitrite reductase subunit c552 [Paludibaculum sp.]
MWRWTPSMALIEDTKKLRDAGATDDQLKDAWAAQRKAQFFIDLVEAENSTGFHAPGESLRVLTQALDTIRKGQLALRGITVVKKAESGRRKKARAGRLAAGRRSRLWRGFKILMLRGGESTHSIA